MKVEILTDHIQYYHMKGLISKEMLLYKGSVKILTFIAAIIKWIS